MAGAVAKPAMRNLLYNKTKKDLWICGAVSIGFAVAFYYGWCVPRKNRVQDFYATYDADRTFDEMVKFGHFQSVKPGDKTIYFPE